MADDATTLRKRADKAWSKNQFQDALAAYSALVTLEPRNRTHRVRVADCLVKLGRTDDAIRTLQQVAEELAAGGMLVGAISMCKMILELNPHHVETQKRLAALYSRRGVATVAAKAGAAAATGVPQNEVVEEVTLEAVMGNLEMMEFDEGDSGLELDTGGGQSDTGVNYRPGQRPRRPPTEQTLEPIPPAAPQEMPELELSMDDAVVQETVSAAVRKTKEHLADELQADMDELLGDMDAFPNVPPTPLFGDLEAKEFERVVEMLTPFRVPAGAVICKEGEPASAMYVIAFGSVRVTTQSASGETIMLAKLTPGDFFGEVALVEGGTRTATVTAVEDAELLEFTKDSFDVVVREFPAVRNVLRMFYFTRTADTYLAKSELFGTLTREERWALVGAMQLKEVPADFTIFKEGQSGGWMFLVRSGGVEVFSGEGDNKHVLAQLGGGDVFGEIAVVELQPRTATVRTSEPTQLFCLHRDAARRAFALNPELGRKVRQIVASRTP